MIGLEFSKIDIAYLLGSFGIAMERDHLPAADRVALIELRDRRAVHLDLYDDVARALGLFSPGRLQ